MTRNEIKKAIYKQKPMANFKFIRMGVAYYETTLDTGETINFEIPVEDMGTADFFPEMDSKFLNRWIYLPEEATNS